MTNIQTIENKISSTRKYLSMLEDYQSRSQSELGVMPPEQSEALKNMVEFRNIVVHDYEDIDFEIVYDILQNKLVDISKFLEITEKALRL